MTLVTPPDAPHAVALAALARDPAPFYRRRIGPGGAVPLTPRRELLEDQLAHPPLGSRRAPGATAPVRLGIAGTGADLLVLGWSAAELARERAAGTRLLGALGVRAGMRVANALPGALATPGALLLGDVVEELGGLDVPLGVVDGAAAANQAWELLARVEPAVIVLDDVSAAPLLAAAPTPLPRWWCGIVWLRRGVLVAPPAVPGFAGWQRTWLAVPEATSFVAGSCAHGRLHVLDDVVAEVVDEETGRARSPGVLALTPLGGETQLLRYVTGIRVRAVACPCGAPGQTIVEA